MSTFSRITDDEMQYYQFKARQHFLVQKEDHEWNEFCKKNKCSCCSCQPSSIQKPLKDIGIQVSSKIPIITNSKVQRKNVSYTEFPDSLNDIRDKLEKINFTLSSLKEEKSTNHMQTLESKSGNVKQKESDSALELISEQRQKIIRTSLLNSMRRLHSFAAHRISKPLLSPEFNVKNRSFFLPPDLQKQRLVARKAYMASLGNKPKIIKKKEFQVIKKQRKEQTEQSIKKPDAHFSISKQRRNKKSPVKRKEKPIFSEDEKTMIQSQHVNKDENIENAVEDIVNDLLKEEISVLNEIKHRKKRMIHGKDDQDKTFKHANIQTENKEILPTKPSSEICAKVKQIPFFNEIITLSEKSRLRYTRAPGDIKKDEENPLNRKIQSQNSRPYEIESQSERKLPSLKNYKMLTIEPKLEKEVLKQRKKYWKYLEKTPCSRTHNFDPVAISRMISESFLEDCIADICNELGDVPTTLIMDLYNQEFMQTL